MADNEEKKCLWLDMTYGFQDHPILILKDEIHNEKEKECGGQCYGCPFRKECTQHESIAWAGITLENVMNHFPEVYRFQAVKGCHSGQYDFEQMFRVYDFSSGMTAYGENGRAAFRVRHENGIVHWIGFEFEHVQSEDIPVILELAECAQQCCDRPMYLCTNESMCRLISLSDKEQLKEFIENKFCKRHC